MLVVFGENDDIVLKKFDGTAENALDPAFEDVIDYMASSNGLEKQSEGMNKMKALKLSFTEWNVFIKGVNYL